MTSTQVLELPQPARPRRFNTLDSMILTAAAALAFLPPFNQYLFAIPTKFRAWNDWVGHLNGRLVIPALVGVDVGSLLAKDVLNFGVGLLINPLVGLTLAVVWMRLRQPRPAFSVLFTQPGFLACVGAVLGCLIFLEATYFGVSASPGAAIALTITTAWGSLAATRQWHAEQTWIDRLGRVVGVLWIAAALCERLERLI